MISLVTGGSKCGKSSFAESLLEGFAGSRIYVAAMQPYGKDALETIERHRRERSGKGFTTAERYTDLAGLSLPKGCGILIEDLPNLLANEMFAPCPVKDPVGTILSGLRRLGEDAAELVIVTSQVGSDGIIYPEETARYIRLLGELSAKAAALADEVFECVCGIPVPLKGRGLC